MTRAAGFAAGKKLGLRMAHSCHRLLIWDCEPIGRDLVLGLPAFLSALGYSEQSRSPLVREFVHPCEHSVVIVPRTGRVQIRVSYLTPLKARKAAARGVASDISAFVEAEARGERPSATARTPGH